MLSEATDSGLDDDALRLSKVLALQAVRRGLPEVLIGRDHLDREVTWAHVLEFHDPGRILSGGELVLTTGAGMGGSAAEQRRWVQAVAAQSPSGLMLEPGRALAHRIPTPVRAAAEDAQLPLIVLRRPVAFVEVARVVSELALSRDAAIRRHADGVAQELTELALDGCSGIDLVEELAVRLGAPIVLQGSAGDLIHCACGPASPAAALAAADWHQRAPRGLGHPGIAVAPLLSGGRHAPAGRLVLISVEQPTDAFQREGLSRAAGVIALQQLGVANLDRLGVRSRGAVLADLAMGRIRDAEIARRVALLGFRWAGRSLLPFAMRCRRDAPVVDALWQRQLAAARAECERRAIPILLGSEGYSALGLAAVPRDVDADAAQRLVGQAIRKGLTAGWAEDRMVVLAFSGPGGDWTDAAAGLRRAARCAEAAETLPPRDWHDARRSRLRELLFELKDRSELQTFAQEQLEPLRAVDDRSESLLSTLRAFIAAGGTKTATAQSLGIDRSTLYTRLERIERALSVDLDEVDVFLALGVAIQTMELSDAIPAIHRPR